MTALLASSLLALALVLLAGGGLLYVSANRQRRRTGLPAGEVIAADTSAWRRSEKSLISERYHLIGKPDYLVETRGGVIPVEVKSTRLSGAEPYDSHKLQLAAYCLLVEDALGVRPTHGILKYANQAIRIPFTNTLRSTLLDTLSQMQAARGAEDVARSHTDPDRCHRCGYRQACGSYRLDF